MYVLFFAAMFSGIIVIAVFGDAKTAMCYIGRGPDSVTVEDFASGKVHSGDFVSLRGSMLRSNGINYTEIKEDKSGREESRSATKYNLLVSPNDESLREGKAIRAICAHLLGLTENAVNRMTTADV